MCEFDFFSVQASSNSIKALRQVGSFKREAIQSRLNYGGRFPQRFYYVSIGFIDVMGIGHQEARRRADELVGMLPKIEGVNYQVKFWPAD